MSESTNQGETKEPSSVGDVVDGISELAEGEDQISLGKVLDKFGSRSFAPIMMVLALIEISPVGAIPGVPTVLAACIILIAGQMVVGKQHIWVPAFIEDRCVSSKKISSATDKLNGIASKLDEWSGKRLEFLTEGAAIQAAGAIIILLCLMVPPLELLPWMAMWPMLAIAIISLAIMVRDGLAMLIAWVVALGAVSGAVYFMMTSNMSLSDMVPF